MSSQQVDDGRKLSKVVLVKDKVTDTAAALGSENAREKVMTKPSPTHPPVNMASSSGSADHFQFAAWLKQQRKNSGMTLEQLAREVRDRGHSISINKLWRIEHGKPYRLDYVLKSTLESCFKGRADSEEGHGDVQSQDSAAPPHREKRIVHRRARVVAMLSLVLGAAALLAGYDFGFFNHHGETAAPKEYSLRAAAMSPASTGGLETRTPDTADIGAARRTNALGRDSWHDERPVRGVSHTRSVNVMLRMSHLSLGTLEDTPE